LILGSVDAEVRIVLPEVARAGPAPKPTVATTMARDAAVQRVSIVPVVLGAGMRLFDGGLPLADGLSLADREAWELTPTRVVAMPDVTHIRYTVDGRAPLVLDDRGSGDAGPA
jgi:hypothetical protein